MARSFSVAFVVVVGTLGLGVLGSSVHNCCTKDTKFGPDMKKCCFMLAENYTNFNHGSFGSAPYEVIAEQRAFQDQQEARPDQWIRGGYEGYLQEVRNSLANFLHANGTDMVFVENASSGINAVLRSLKLQPGDVVLDLSIAYGMVKNTLSYLSEREGVTIVTVNVEFPGHGMTPTGEGGSDLVEAVQKALIAHRGHVKLASFSQIASCPAVILPVLDLAKVAASEGVPVLIDGAHAFGQIPVDLTAMESAGVHFWVGNGHKWLYSPKGSAVLWVSKGMQAQIVPTVISSAFPTGVVPRGSDFLNHFQYTGTRDYTPFCAMQAALNFRQRLGEDTLSHYCSSLALWAQKHLAEVWGTEYLLPDEMTAFMGHVRLPPNVPSDVGARLYQEEGIEVTVFPLATGNTTTPALWLRLSAQVYLEQEDFRRLGQAVQKLLL